MRIAYLDCASGISGDMTLAALVDAGADLAEVQRGIDSLGLPSCQLAATEVKRKGFRALQLTVQHEPEHKHRHLHHITAMIEGSSVLSPRQKELATRIFRRLAEAEAKVHGSTIEKVHFHEVGAVDSIADIVGSAIAWDLLGVERILCAPVPTGSGFVEIAHGRCSIPAPATAELLAGVPLADFAVEGELTTPTGAAIVAALVDDFGPLPAMTIERIGYGAGQKDFAHPNLLRILLGETAPIGAAQPHAEGAGAGGARLVADAIVLLETNLDDVSGEAIGFTVERLWAAGALDVSTTALTMKKNRPGVLLAVQCRPADADELASIVFRETTALGLRRSTVSRLTLPRRSVTVATPFGPIAGVAATLPDGALRFSPEYEACAEAARRQGAALADVDAAARMAYEASREKR
ncbi:MAG TPA: nickel pincer cofactor biosynthesis protein LarC [Lacipirellulaceae bacterium]|nr:nickel pincer cofactor biosynthesis protein LarC [Lacipirellulaceae bacterium]